MLVAGGFILPCKNNEVMTMFDAKTEAQLDFIDNLSEHEKKKAAENARIVFMDTGMTLEDLGNALVCLNKPLADKFNICLNKATDSLLEGDNHDYD
jgi:hypothetical protein